jgi:hypothetical protein
MDLAERTELTAAEAVAWAERHDRYVTRPPHWWPAEVDECEWWDAVERHLGHGSLWLPGEGWVAHRAVKARMRGEP